MSQEASDSKRQRLLLHNGKEFIPVSNRNPDFKLPKRHSGLRLSSQEALSQCGRVKCPSCDTSRAYFCYDCMKTFTPTPELSLPASLHILGHRDERRSKATGIHAAVLCPTSAHFYRTVDELPTEIATSPSTVVLFPDKEAKTVAESLEDGPIDHVVVIDSTWDKAKGVMGDSRLQGCRKVKLVNCSTSFWRYQPPKVGEGGVSTIEAIFFLCREIHIQRKVHEGSGEEPRAAAEVPSGSGSPGGGGGAAEEVAAAAAAAPPPGQVAGLRGSTCHCFDDLLWYFDHMHQLVEKRATQKLEQLKTNPEVDRKAAKKKLAQAE